MVVSVWLELVELVSFLFTTLKLSPKTFNMIVTTAYSSGQQADPRELDT